MTSTMIRINRRLHALTLGLLILIASHSRAALAQESAPPAEAPEVNLALTENSPAPDAKADKALDAKATDVPRGIVDARYQQIREICAESIDETQMREKIKALTVDFVDYEEFSRLTIKRQWKELNEAQRAEFVDWFRRLIQATYARHFKPRQDIAVSYRGETKFKGEKAQVKTTLSFKKNAESAVDVDYRFHKRTAREAASNSSSASKAQATNWWVYDLVIDEVSLMRNYRSQFRKILKRDGFDALMTKVRDAVKRKESDDDGSNEL
jgi:phospholipid transport system substrate-binding protein